MSNYDSEIPAQGQPDSQSQPEQPTEISDRIQELNLAYKQAVDRQLRTLELEQTAFRQLDFQRSTVSSTRHSFKSAGENHVPVDERGGLSRISRRYRAIGLGLAAVPVLLILCFAASALLPARSVSFSFAKVNNCVVDPALLPGQFKANPGSTFIVTHPASLSVFHTALFSYRLCVSPNTQPLASKIYNDKQSVNLFVAHIGKTQTVNTGKYPLVSAGNVDIKALPLIKPAKFTLASPDETFSYAVQAGAKTSACTKNQTTLTCNLLPLGLNYGSKYEISVVRVFKNQQSGAALTKNVQTITATAIAQTSIPAGTIVYDTPQSISIVTSKQIKNLGKVTLSATVNGAKTDIPVKTTFKGSTITVNDPSALPRRTALDLHIDQLTAVDQSQLEQSYDLSFNTSGGPKVAGSNIATYGLASGNTMVVSFDQALNSSQDPNQFASLVVNGAKQPAALSLNGRQLTIKPSNPYPVCASVAVQLSATAQNPYGVTGDSAWNLTSRSHCYTNFSIGTSVKGRPITGYQFGSGGSLVLFIGAMEGNEQNSAELLQQWIPNIDANPSKIPAGRTVVVIPQINPDGFAANTRVNAAGIDLNRNFPSNNWQTQVTEPLANNVWTNDGGPTPLSAPEAQALANYFQTNHPRLTLTMHSHGAIVEANDAGDSDALGTRYANLAGYRAIPTSAIGNFFNYTTTGAFEDWAKDKIGLPVLEVELESPTAVEYSRNLPALWAMAQVSQ